MTILLTLAHVFVCFFLILVVLLQTGKGADVAAAFGGSSQTAFGARGASTFLSKMTTVSAVIFMLTSLVLSLMSSRPGSSVLESTPASQAPISAPAPGAVPPPAAQAPPAGGTAPSGGTAGTEAAPKPATPQPASPAAGGGSKDGTPPPGSGN